MPKPDLVDIPKAALELVHTPGSLVRSLPSWAVSQACPRILHQTIKLGLPTVTDGRVELQALIR